MAKNNKSKAATAQKPNVEYIFDYFDIKAGTQTYLKTIPKQLKHYVRTIN